MGVAGNPSAPQVARTSRREAVAAQVRALVGAIRDGDEALVERSVLTLSRSHRAFAPLAFVVGAFVMLFDGVKLLVLNWRLLLVQVLPAMWIWLAMFDLKAHVLRGKSFHVLRGPILIPIVAAITAVTAASFFLNAVFAFAIVAPAQPEIRPAFARANAHRKAVLGAGALVGLALAFSSVVVVRWGLRWFALSLGIVVGVMMVCYVAIPSRLLGISKHDVTQSRKDKLAASALGGALGAVVCSPPYALGRIGILMLGSHTLFVLGVVFVVVGFGLQAGATGSVKAIKMSTKLTAGRSQSPPGA